MATPSTEIRVTPQIAAEHGLTAEECARVKQILGREPNITELGIFSVMWSEHCSYKSSKVHLKRLPTRGKLVVQGPGENAGVVDIGDGRSEERRVGKECRCRWGGYEEKKKIDMRGILRR